MPSAQFETHIVMPSDHKPVGPPLIPTAETAMSLESSRLPSAKLYAYTLASSQSATHNVTPSDQMPCGLPFPAASRVPSSLAAIRSPGDGVVKVMLAISFTSFVPLVHAELSYAV